jgi:DNA-binding GntR family transcriptional regulator
MSVTLDRRMSPQQVSKAIRDDLIRRVFEPGQRLTEDSLAEWCGGLVAAYRLQERGSGHAR